MPSFNVATKAVIFNEDQEVLLITKSDLEDINPNTVDIPGGRLEYKETPEEGIKREVLEEVGLEIEIIAPSRTWTLIKEEKDFQLVGVTFACISKNKEVITLSDEHTSAKWLTQSQILEGDFPKWLKEEVKAATLCYRYIKHCKILLY